MKRRGSSGDGRRIRETVRGSKKRSESSRRWLERQLNDPYVHRAKAEGYRSRAAFKLVAIGAGNRSLSCRGRASDRARSGSVLIRSNITPRRF